MEHGLDVHSFMDNSHQSPAIAIDKKKWLPVIVCAHAVAKLEKVKLSGKAFSHTMNNLNDNYLSNRMHTDKQMIQVC